MPSRKGLAFRGGFLAALWIALVSAHPSIADEPGSSAMQRSVRQDVVPVDPAKVPVWEQRWQKTIVAEARNRYCDTEMGEEIGWLMSPLLNGFYYGYLATGDARWAELLVDWTDAWIRRGVTEPDGFVGWPKVGASGTPVDGLDSYDADSLLGEAMALRPVVLMSAAILNDPPLKARYGDKAEAYLKLARSMYEKWDARGAWRPSGDGLMTVVLPFGLDGKRGRWTDGYQERNAAGHGFSHPDNKANLVASWLLAMSDATGERLYLARAEKWFRVMKSRMKLRSDGSFHIWNYWQPAGAWDYKPDGAAKHWIGIHPNAGYYVIDVDAIVAAYEHGVVFTADDIGRLAKTALANSRNWPALTPYDRALQTRFERSIKPDGWAELTLVPWYLSLQKRRVN